MKIWTSSSDQVRVLEHAAPYIIARRTSCKESWPRLLFACWRRMGWFVWSGSFFHMGRDDRMMGRTPFFFSFLLELGALLDLESDPVDSMRRSLGIAWGAFMVYWRFCGALGQAETGKEASNTFMWMWVWLWVCNLYEYAFSTYREYVEGTKKIKTCQPVWLIRCWNIWWQDLFCVRLVIWDMFI